GKDFFDTHGLVNNELLRQTCHTKDEFDLLELNEAFAAVSLVSAKIADIDPEMLHDNGGDVALGHPLGSSRARVIFTLIRVLKRRGGGFGVAAICSGGWQGDAVLIEVHP